MDWLTQSIPTPLEIASLVFTVASIYFAVKRNESAFFKDRPPEEETRQHFYKY